MAHPGSGPAVGALRLADRALPVWATIDAGQVHAAATAGLAWLALSGCTTSTDHHYIFPREAGGELRTVDAATATREVRAARQRLVGPGLS